jgi:threonine 3-dehydrogenase
MAANQTVMEQAFDMVRIRGTVVTIGTFNAPVTFNPFFKMSRREIRLLSMMGRTWESWRRMNQMIDAEVLDIKPFVTHILPMEQYREGFDLVKNQKAMKVLLEP